MEPEGSLPCSQEPSICTYPEPIDPVHTTPHHTTPSYLRSTLTLSTHLHLGLSSGLFPSGFPTNICIRFLRWSQWPCSLRHELSLHAGMDVCVYSVFVLGNGLVMGWSLVQGVLLNVLDEETEVKQKVFHGCPMPQVGATAINNNIPLLPHSCYMPCPSHPPWLDHSDYIWWRVQLMKLLIMQFSPISHHFTLFSPHNLLSTLFSNTLSLCSSISITDYVSHPYRTTGKIILLYILIFMFLNSRNQKMEIFKNQKKGEHVWRLHLFSCTTSRIM
jgi:hypothetical protein